MKKRDLERHLVSQGCRMMREGANHEMWENRPRATAQWCRAIAGSRPQPLAASADNSRSRHGRAGDSHSILLDRRRSRRRGLTSVSGCRRGEAGVHRPEPVLGVSGDVGGRALGRAQGMLSCNTSESTNGSVARLPAPVIVPWPWSPL